MKQQKQKLLEEKEALNQQCRTSSLQNHSIWPSRPSWIPPEMATDDKRKKKS